LHVSATGSTRSSTASTRLANDRPQRAEHNSDNDTEHDDSRRFRSHLRPRHFCELRVAGSRLGLASNGTVAETN